jgi:hypothetical protein
LRNDKSHFPLQPPGRMKAHQALAMIAANAFIVSLFPTALDNSSPHFNRGNPLTGMDCFLISLIACVEGDGLLVCSGVANLAFFLLVGMLLGSWPRFLKTRLVVSLLACGSALSWVLFLGHSGDLGSAYYLWLGAHMFLFLGHFSAVRKSRHFIDVARGIGR